VTDQHSVLITGANGFVGSRLCRSLKADGYHVIAQVRKNSDLRLLEPLDLEYRYGDITRPETLPEIVSGVDYIVHNAGVIKADTKDWFFEVNERGTRNLLDAVLEHNPTVRRVVHISSVAAAGPSTAGRPLTESDEPHPITTYGESKLAGEKAARSYADRINLTVVRPPGVYGPGDRGIYSMFQTVYKHLKPLIGDGNRKLQLVHVDDLCLGVSKALAAATESGRVYFIAEKDAYTYRELINTLVAASGRWTVPLYLPSPLFRAIATISEFSFRAIGVTPLLTREKTRELNSSWEMDVSHAREDLKFESQIRFADGAADTFKWYIRQGWL
jgi:nucleoside-diphosphate-sugar epimerase